MLLLFLGWSLFFSVFESCKRRLRYFGFFLFVLFLRDFSEEEDDDEEGEIDEHIFFLVCLFLFFIVIDFVFVFVFGGERVLLFLLHITHLHIHTLLTNRTTKPVSFKFQAQLLS